MAPITSTQTQGLTKTWPLNTTKEKEKQVCLHFSKLIQILYPNIA